MKPKDNLLLRKWLLIGYGNSIKSDDRFGLEIIQQLQNILPNNSVDFITAHQLLPELAKVISLAKGVIFIDASASLPPGKFECLEIKPASNTKTTIALGHFLTPEILLQHTHSLYGHIPQSWLYTVGGEHFYFGEELSSTVKAMLPIVIEKICQKINNQSIS